jgi:hypothetical protein
MAANPPYFFKTVGGLMGPEPPLKSVTASLDASPENKWGRKKRLGGKKRNG